MNSDPVTPFPKFGAGIGLHRVRAIAQTLDLDLAHFADRACVITGSNGKGSVAAMTAAMLAACEGPVGRFTSPHLFSIRERFSIDGEDIDPEALDGHWRRVYAAARAYEARRTDDHVGGFEFLFLVAASWFAEQRCAFTVWEAGIGGRYDPVRLIKARRGALVSLDLEHTRLLGDTLDLIAFDKLDAFPDGAEVWAGPMPAHYEERIGAYARVRDLALHVVAPAHGEGALDVDVGDAHLRLPPPLAGPHQRANTQIAAHLACALLGAGSAARFGGALAEGLARTRWPGRLERIEQKPPIVVDVGHTPDAVRQSRAGFLDQFAPCVLVCGVSADKEANAIIEALAPAFKVIVCAAARHKGRPAAELAPLARAANPEAEIVVAADMADARVTALHRAAERNGAIYVAGGLFAAIEFKALHLGMDPRTLHFF